MVGGGARSRLPSFALAIPLAGAFCLPARDRRISLHGLDAGSRARLVDRSGRSRNTQCEINFPARMGYSVGFRSQCAGLARSAGLYPWFRATIAGFRGPFSMAGAGECLAGADPSLLDGEMGRFLVPDDAARRGRACLRPCSTGSGDRRISREGSTALAKSALGNRPPPRRPPARDDPDRGRFSMELSLVAAFSSHPWPLRSRSAAVVVDGRNCPPSGATGIPRARAGCTHGRRDALVGSWGNVRLPSDVDFSLDRFGLDGDRIGAAQINATLRLDAHCGRIRRFADNIFLHSAELWCAQIQFLGKIARPCATRSGATLFEHLSAA